MSPDGSIAAHHIWKRFRADRRPRDLRARLTKRPGRRGPEGGRGWTWALNDVDLMVQPGESVALVGRNGSGKSTLLKILTRVMFPYAGEVEVGGRVGAMIEVRAGIHPELTGRENVYLYGSLLGLSRRQIEQRFDEIVDFAQLDTAIDRQVKFFSSGMYMRLGFGVAAYLEPHVLLVDEVLSVGDATFQQRCLDRMRAVLAQGTTLVFVSHDLAAVEATCTRGVWLDQGKVQVDGPVGDVLGAYRRSVEETAEQLHRVDGIVRLIKTEVTTPGGEGAKTGGPLDVRLVIESDEAVSAVFCIGVTEGTPSPAILLRTERDLVAGQMEIRCSMEGLPLPRGGYFLWVGIFDKKRDLLPWQPVARFNVFGPALGRGPRGIVRLAPIHVAAVWQIERS